MNLVVDCMQVISGRPLNYFRNHQPEFLFHLLKRCLKKPMSPVYKRKLKEIYGYVEQRNDSLGLWRDCEVYNPIDFMTISKDEEYFPYTMELLQVLIGMKDIRKSKRLPDGYYRLRNLSGHVYEIRNQRLISKPENLIWNIPGFKPDIYLPKSGMFSDILLDRYYPDMAEPYDVSSVKNRVRASLDLMKCFSADIWEDFQEATTNLVLLTSAPHTGVDSLTMTFKYFGGIFFNCFTNDEYRGVESLVHEYIHNRCSLWWEMLPPTGIPADGISIISPMTGNKVLASTMIHALIIYVSALQFYRHIQSTKMPSDRTVARRLDRRVAHLSNNMPVLYRRLSKRVRPGTDIRRLMDYLMEVYIPLKEARSRA